MKNYNFCQILISCTSKKEAQKITDFLLKDKLIACGEVVLSDSNYWWKGKIEKEKRFLIVSYSIMDKKNEIIDLIKKNHSDEIPGIVFINIDANKEFLDWIIESLN